MFTRSNGSSADRSDYPLRRTAIVTCMDPRVVLGSYGDADETFMLRNAGGRVTDDVIRGLVLCTRLLDVTEIGVLQHTDCRLHGRTNDELTQLTGADVDFLPSLNPAETLASDVNRLRTCGLFGRGVSIWGGLYLVESQTTSVLVPSVIQ
jgi:carbonic anhydrase